MGKTKAVASTKKTKGKSKAIYIGDPNVYKVDRILQERKVGRKWEYFVKWSGYPDTENSWVSQIDITPDLVDEFKRKNAVRDQASQETPLNTESDTRDDSYFEEGIHNMGFNVQLQSPLEHFQLFNK